MAELTPDRLLAVWEHGARRHPIDRALLLFALAAPEIPVEQLADAPLSRRNAALAALHRASFGARLAAWADCSACGERMEFELDPSRLLPPPEEDLQPIEIAGHRFRRPTSRDMARLAGATDLEAAARQLLHECAESPGALPREKEALADVLGAVEAAMDAADPWADLALGIRCPGCGHEETVPLDIAGVLWEKVEDLARHLLDEVHLLAHAYGWTERQILALSDARRAAYIERVRS